MTEKKISNKVIKFTAHPNIDKALRQYCEDNNVLISDVLKLILLDFLWNATTSSQQVKESIKKMYVEDLMARPESPKKSQIHKNYDLMKILVNHACDLEISESLDQQLEKEESISDTALYLAHDPMIQELMKQSIKNNRNNRMDIV